MSDFPKFSLDLLPDDAPSYAQVNWVFIKEFIANIDRVNEILTVEECIWEFNERKSAAHTTVLEYHNILCEYSHNYFKLSANTVHWIASNMTQLWLHVESILNHKVPESLDSSYSRIEIDGGLISQNHIPVMWWKLSSDQFGMIWTGDHKGVLDSLQLLTENILTVNWVNIGN